MKKLFCIILLMLIIPSTPVLAYTVPVQGSDNATDVIMWHGDEATVNVFIPDLNDVVEKTITDQGERWFSLALVALIVIWTLINKGWFWELLACPTMIVYGLNLAGNSTPGEFIWVAGVVIAIFGTYFLYKVSAIGLSLIKAKATR